VWDNNRIAKSLPRLEAFLDSPYARGGVTGVGVVTALAGLVEIGSLFASRARARETTPPGSPTQPPPA
jgi:hypothetical protein